MEGQNLIFSLLIACVASVLVSIIGTPLVRQLAIQLKIVAAPNHRTIHNGHTPKIGGVTIFAAFVVGILGYAYLQPAPPGLWAFVAGGSVMFLVGLSDDVFQLGCYHKLLGQIVAAAVAVYFGITVEAVLLPDGQSQQLGYLGPVLSVLWIVTITNALNLLDGLDGLAAGVTILSALFLAMVAVSFDNSEIAIVALLLIFATTGFAKYNLPPAKIFMGDTGSLFLGFVLACLSLKVFTISAKGTHISALIVLFSLPLADMVLAILRRVRQGVHPFHADKKHIHHRLLEAGSGERKAVLIIFLITALGGLVSLLLLISEFHQSMLWLTTFWAVGFLFLKHIGCFDFMKASKPPSSGSSGKTDSGVEEIYQEEISAEQYDPWHSKRADKPLKKKFHTPA